jgi:hypothetical protein
MFNRKKKNLTTVNDVLKADDIKEALKVLVEASPKIADLIIIFMDAEGNYTSIITHDTSAPNTVFLLELVKRDLLCQTDTSNKD